MKWLQWDDGRQFSGYAKMLIVTSKLLKFDVYILRIPDGTGVPPHIDPVTKGWCHHRLNIQLNRPTIGTGKMTVKGPVKTFLFGRAVYFRPDLYEHWMTPGAEYIHTDHATFLLTIGWLRHETNQAPTSPPLL